MITLLITILSLSHQIGDGCKESVKAVVLSYFYFHLLIPLKCCAKIKRKSRKGKQEACRRSISLQEELREQEILHGTLLQHMQGENPFLSQFCFSTAQVSHVYHTQYILDLELDEETS